KFCNPDEGFDLLEINHVRLYPQDAWTASVAWYSACRSVSSPWGERLLHCDARFLDGFFPTIQFVFNMLAEFIRAGCDNLIAKAFQLFLYGWRARGVRERFVQLVHNRFRRSRGSKNAIPAVHNEVRVARFFNGGYIGQQC